MASIIVKEVEPLHLLFIEEPCPPENVQAMGRVARRSTTPIATGERLVAAYGCRELIEMGIVDILQTDINHVGGVTGCGRSRPWQTSPTFRWRRMRAKDLSGGWLRCMWTLRCPTF